MSSTPHYHWSLRAIAKQSHYWSQQEIAASHTPRNNRPDVTLYLTREAIAETLGNLTSLAPGSVVAIAFYLPLGQLDEEDRRGQEIAIKGAAAAGTPFVSFFFEEEIVALARIIGLKEIQIISTKDMTEKYFKNRADGLLPASGEFFLLAKT